MGKKRTSSPDRTSPDRNSSDGLRVMSESRRIDTTVMKPCSKTQAIGTTSELEPASGSESNLKKQKMIMESEFVAPRETDEDTITVSKTVFEDMKNSIKVLTETITRLKEISFKNESSSEKKDETPTKKGKKLRDYTCCYDCEGAYNNIDGIIVSGYDTNRSRDEIKKDLTEIFSTCGEVTRVFVPIECKTGVPLRFAFFNLKDCQGNEKALRYNNSRIRGSKYKVKMAIDSHKLYHFPDFKGCKRCQFSKSNPRKLENAWYNDIAPSCISHH